MVITTTAIAFILLALGLAVCGFWFWRAFRKTGSGRGKDNKTGFLLGLFIFASALQNGVLGFGVLFFAPNSEKLYLVILVTQILMALHVILGVISVRYIFFPSSSPYLMPATAGVFGLAVIILTMVEHPVGFVTAHNSVDWNMSFSLSFLVFALLSISIGSFFYVFFRLFLGAKTLTIKILSLLLAVLGLGGIVSTFIRFILLYPTDIRTHLLSISMGLIGIIFLVVLIVVPILQQARTKKLEIDRIEKP